MARKIKFYLCMSYMSVIIRCLIQVQCTVDMYNGQVFIQTDSELRYNMAPDVHGRSIKHMAGTDDSSAFSLESTVVRFEPPILDFAERAVGMAHSERVTIENLDFESLHLLSISSNSLDFHCSFFNNQVVRSLGNATFEVVFLPRHVGKIENILYIHSSKGSFQYQVHGVGVENPYRVRPFLGARVPINTSFNPIIHIHNPHGSMLQIEEIYTSAGDLHLELPLVSGEKERVKGKQQEVNMKELWAIPPFATRSIMKANFLGRVENNHSMFIRIRTNRDTRAQKLILPVEVEVTSVPGIFSTVEMIDFGMLRTLDKPRIMKLNVLNSLPMAVHITNVTVEPPNGAIQVEFKRTRVRYDLLLPTTIARVTFTVFYARCKQDNNENKNPIQERLKELLRSKQLVQSEDNFNLFQIAGKDTYHTDVGTDKTGWSSSSVEQQAPRRERKTLLENDLDEILSSDEDTIHRQVSADSLAKSLFPQGNPASIFVTENGRSMSVMHYDPRNGPAPGNDPVTFSELDRLLLQGVEDLEKRKRDGEGERERRKKEKMEKYQTHEFSITSTFQSTVIVYDVTLASDLRQYFTIHNFSRPLAIAPHETRPIFNLTFRFHDDVHSITSYFILRTNSTDFRIPLYVYDGKLEVVIHGQQEWTANSVHLDFGTMAFNEKKMLTFSIMNNSPADIMLSSVTTNVKGAMIHMLGIETSKGVSFREARFALEFTALYFEGHGSGHVFIKTPYENQSIPVTLRVTTGSLRMIPARLFFSHCFPGKVCSVDLRIFSTFNQTVEVYDVRITGDGDDVDDGQESRIYFKFSSATDYSSQTMIPPGKDNLIGMLLFNERLRCADDCYLGLPTETELGRSWLTGLALKEGVANIDRFLFERFKQKWSRLRDQGQHIINVTVELDTTNVKGFKFLAQAQLHWPTVVRSGVGIKGRSQCGSFTLVEFEVTEIGNSVTQDIHFDNPSDEPIILQVVDISLYPSVQTLIDTVNPYLSTCATSSSSSAFCSSSCSLCNSLDLIAAVMAGDFFQNVTSSDNSNKNKSHFSILMTPQINCSPARNKSTLRPAQRVQDEEQHGSESPVPYFFKDIEVHPATFLREIPAHSSVCAKLTFNATDEDVQTSMYIVRNNLTIVDLVIIRGRGGVAEFRLNHRLPGSERPLNFLLSEQYLQLCYRKREEIQGDPIFTLRRSFTARNPSHLPLHIYGFSIDNTSCEGSGFRVLNCQPHTLLPGSTYKIDIAYIPDFSLSRGRHTLTIHTSLRGDDSRATFLIHAMIPPHLLGRCAALLPRPPFEPVLYYLCVVVLTFGLFCIFSGAYLSAERLCVADVLYEHERLKQAALAIDSTTESISAGVNRAGGGKAAGRRGRTWMNYGKTSTPSSSSENLESRSWCSILMTWIKVLSSRWLYPLKSAKSVFTKRQVSDAKRRYEYCRELYSRTYWKWYDFCLFRSYFRGKWQGWFGLDTYYRKVKSNRSKEAAKEGSPKHAVEVCHEESGGGVEGGGGEGINRSNEGAGSRRVSLSGNMTHSHWSMDKCFGALSRRKQRSSPVTPPSPSLAMPFRPLTPSVDSKTSSPRLITPTTCCEPKRPLSSPGISFARGQRVRRHERAATGSPVSDSHFGRDKLRMAPVLSQSTAETTEKWTTPIQDVEKRHKGTLEPEHVVYHPVIIAVGNTEQEHRSFTLAEEDCKQQREEQNGKVPEKDSGDDKKLDAGKACETEEIITDVGNKMTKPNRHRNAQKLREQNSVPVMKIMEESKIEKSDKIAAVKKFERKQSTPSPPLILPSHCGASQLLGRDASALDSISTPLPVLTSNKGKEIKTGPHVDASDDLRFSSLPESHSLVKPDVSAVIPYAPIPSCGPRPRENSESFCHVSRLSKHTDGSCIFSSSSECSSSSCSIESRDGGCSCDDSSSSGEVSVKGGRSIRSFTRSRVVAKSFVVKSTSDRARAGTGMEAGVSCPNRQPLKIKNIDHLGNSFLAASSASSSSSTKENRLERISAVNTTCFTKKARKLSAHVSPLMSTGSVNKSSSSLQKVSPCKPTASVHYIEADLSESSPHSSPIPPSHVKNAWPPKSQVLSRPTAVENMFSVCSYQGELERDISGGRGRVGWCDRGGEGGGMLCCCHDKFSTTDIHARLRQQQELGEHEIVDAIAACFLAIDPVLAGLSNLSNSDQFRSYADSYGCRSCCSSVTHSQQRLLHQLHQPKMTLMQSLWAERKYRVQEYERANKRAGSDWPGFDNSDNLEPLWEPSPALSSVWNNPEDIEQSYTPTTPPYFTPPPTPSLPCSNETPAKKSPTRSGIPPIGSGSRRQCQTSVVSVNEKRSSIEGWDDKVYDIWGCHTTVGPLAVNPLSNMWSFSSTDSQEIGNDEDLALKQPAPEITKHVELAKSTEVSGVKDPSAPVKVVGRWEEEEDLSRE